MLTNKETTRQFRDSYTSVKCVGAGNGRVQSKITAKLRRQLNKKRRRVTKQISE